MLLCLYFFYIVFSQVHHLGLSKPYRCFFCKDGFSTETELHAHVTTHKKQYVCPVCHEAFFVEYLLDKHLETKHSGSELCLGDMTVSDTQRGSSNEAQSALHLQTSSPSTGVVEHKVFLSSPSASFNTRLSPAVAAASSKTGPSVCKCEVYCSHFIILII